MPTPNGKKEPSAPLPKSLIQALPASSTVMKHVAAIVSLIPQLEKEMAAAEKRGAIDLARSYAVLHRLREILRSDEKSWFKPISNLFDDYNNVKVPAAFEQAGITHVPLAEGYRVGISHTWRASIKKDMKKEAYAWLEQNNHGDIITETVNASTLSALAKELNEEQNQELPEKLFTSAHMPATSVTKT